MKQKLIPIAAIAVGIAAFALSSIYLEKKRAEIDKARDDVYGTEKIQVVVASHEISKGTVISEEDIGWNTVPEFQAIFRGRAVKKSEANLILGRKLLFNIRKGELIQWSDIEGGLGGALSLAPMIKPGLRALSLSVGGASAVSGMIQPNDRIDILGTFTFPSKTVRGQMETVTLTVLQDVTVLATGKTLAKSQLAGHSGGGYSSVTVSVTPREAELLVFAQQVQGRLTLALRNPNDNGFERRLPVVNFEHLETKIEEYNMHRQREIRHKSGM